MKIGKRCIVVGDKITKVPDDHIVINLASLDLSKLPVIIGPNQEGIKIEISKSPTACKTT